jgi:hypothetical protein
VTIKASLWAYMDRRPAGPISGWDLFREMKRRTGKNTYPTVLLKYAHDYADRAGALFECINTRESRYEYTPGVKISGARS